jgi:hypothetical protein
MVGACTRGPFQGDRHDVPLGLKPWGGADRWMGTARYEQGGLVARLAAVGVLAMTASSCAPYWFGSDNYSPEAAQPGAQATFWLGRVGEGEDPAFLLDANPYSGCLRDAFSAPSAAGAQPNVVDPHRQFAVWWLRGPSTVGFTDPYNPGSTGVVRAYDLGWAQGMTAYLCWVIQAIHDGTNGPSIGLDIFADVEINELPIDPSTGLSVPDTPANEYYYDSTEWYHGSLDQEQINENTQALVGFLDAVGSLTRVSPGVYVERSQEEQIFPGINLATGCSIYRCPDPYQPAIWWQAGGCDAAGAVVTTYPQVPPASQVQDEMANIEANTQGVAPLPNGQVAFFPGPCSLLYLKPALWQYVIGSTDFDIVDSSQHLSPSGGLPEQRQCGVYPFLVFDISVCGDYFVSTPVYVGIG